MKELHALAFIGLLGGLATPGAAQDRDRPPLTLPSGADAASQVPPVTDAPLPDRTAPAVPVTAVPPGSLPDLPAGTTDNVRFSADVVTYDDAARRFTATGNVHFGRDGEHLRADRVDWNQATGEVVATGNVAARNPEGDTAYAERMVLTDTLRRGVIDDLLVVRENGARFAARRGERFENGDMRLNYAAYTPCRVESRTGCPKNPSWQIKAVRVDIEKASGKVRYRGARAELFGIPLPVLPLFVQRFGNTPQSGLMVPDVRIDRNNGLEIVLPYYLRMAPNRDATITPHIFSNALPMLEGEYRQLDSKGALRIGGFVTSSRRIDIAEVADPSAINAGSYALRAYVDGSGRYQFDPNWSLTGSVRRATDRTFLRRYDISYDDRLRSTVNLERIGRASYFSLSGWAFQTLRANDPQGQQPVAAPSLDWRLRLDDPVLGGVTQLQANALSLLRTDGQDTQRAFAGAQWSLGKLTPWGQIVDFTLLARGDIYHSDHNLLTPVPAYRGERGWQARGIAAAAVDMRWPFAGPLWGGTQRVRPRIQFAASPPVRNIDLPNEDARAFDLDDGNLFSLNRFPGYDRYDDSVRATYGVEWSYDRPGLAIDSVVGQSYHFTRTRGMVQPGTGLSDRFSDYVGRVSIAYRDFLRFTGRFRLDKDHLTLRRNEIDARIGDRRTYAEVSYLRLNRDIIDLVEDLRDREEIRAGGRIQITPFWSLFGSAIVDLTSRNEDALSAGDGFSPIRHRLGFTYEDDCLLLGATWRREYEDTGDARRGNSFLLRLAIRNFGL